MTAEDRADILYRVALKGGPLLDDVIALVDHIEKLEAKVRDQGMTPAEVAKMVRQGYQPTVRGTVLLMHRINQLEAALQPFAQVVIGEHRDDHDHVWHSLKVYHFRDARKVLKGEEIHG